MFALSVVKLYVKIKVNNMYETITQAEYRNIIGTLIRDDAERLRFGLKVIEPLLDSLRFEELQPYLSGNDGLIETMDILSDNIALIVKDRLVDEDSLVYMIKNDMPVKVSKEYYDNLIKDFTVIKKY